jgi:hypothetical protein
MASARAMRCPLLASSFIFALINRIYARARIPLQATTFACLKGSESGQQT